MIFFSFGVIFMWFKWDSFVLFRVYLRFDFRLHSTSYFRLEALYNANTYRGKCYFGSVFVNETV